MAEDIQSNIKINIDTTQALENIRLLQGEISAFHTQMAKMGSANAAQAANMRQNLINAINGTNQFTASVTRIKTSAESFTEALEKNKMSMGEYFRFAGAASKSFGKYFKTEFDTIEKVAGERVKDLQTQYIKLGRDANGAMQAIKVRPLILDMESLGTKSQIAAQKQQLLNQLLKQGSTAMLNWGKNTQWAGRQLMVGFTIPLTIMGGAAMKAYKQIEEGAIRIRRVYGDLNTTTQETEKMVSQIKQLALEFTKYGVAVKDTMEMAATAAATGKKGADLLQQVSNANKLAVLGGIEQEKALQTTISLTNAFGIASKDLAENINFLNAVENQTVLNIDDLTTAIPKAAPVIQQLGGDVKDLAFFLTAMKEGGVNASEGANAIKSGLASLINPTNAASKMLAGLGINIKAIVEKDKGNLKQTVVDFANALDTLDPLNRARAIEQLFGKFQFARMSTLFKNVVTEGTQASEVLNLANQSALELSMMAQKELRKIQESPLYKFQKAMADFQAQLAPVGEQFMKAVTPLIEFGSSILEKFNGMSDGVKQFIVRVVSIGGVIGPVLLMTTGLVANAVANIIKGFSLVKDLFNKTGKSSLSLGEQVSYMTQAQIQSAAVASSLEQVHSKLKQTFTAEAAAVDMLTGAYERAIAVQRGLNVPNMPRGPIRTRKATGGYISGPGTETSDSIPAYLSNGEYVVRAGAVKKIGVSTLDKLNQIDRQGFAGGGYVGLPTMLRRFIGPLTEKAALKEQQKIMALEKMSSQVMSSQYRGMKPMVLPEQISPSTGHSFVTSRIGGIYEFPDGRRAFIKPQINLESALAELRGAQIAREAHGLTTPQQTLRVIIDPTDPSGKRRLFALESPLDERIANIPKTFTRKEFFQQLVASLIRGDKDLGPGNLGGSILADVGPAGVFAKASGNTAMSTSMLSMEQQAMINLLGIKGGARKFFAQATSDIARTMSPFDYSIGIKKEIDRVLPKLADTIARMDLTPAERPYYEAMIQRLEAGKNVDWSKFRDIHAQVPGFANGGIVNGPGTETSDSILAMISKGEAVIDAKTVKKNPAIIQALFAGKQINIPGYAKNNSQSFKDEKRAAAAMRAEAEGEATAFAHLLDSQTITLSQLITTLENAGGTVYPILRELQALGLGGVSTGVYGGLGFSTKQKFNNLMKPIKLSNGTVKPAIGVDTQEFLQDWDSRKVNKKNPAGRWSDTLKVAGLNAKDVGDELKTLDKGIREQIVSAKKLDKSFKVTDEAMASFAQKTLKEMQANGSKMATSFLRAGQTVTEFRVRGNVSEIKDVMEAEEGRGAGHFVTPGGRKVKAGNVAKKAQRTKGGLGFSAADIVVLNEAGEQIVFKAAEEVTAGVAKGVKKRTRMKSPSKDGTEIGENYGDSLNTGARSRRGKAKQTGEELANDMIDSASATGKKKRASKKRTQSSTETTSDGQNVTILSTSPDGVDVDTKSAKPRGRFGKFATGLGGKMMGASLLTGLGSMVPGPIGEISGMLSMPLMMGSMFGDAIGNKVSSVKDKMKLDAEFASKIGLATKLFSRLSIALTVAVVAYEIITPLIRKNADSFLAMANILSSTREKMQKIDEYFGTQGTKSLIEQGAVAATGQKTSKANMVEDFRQSQSFKDLYEADSQKIKGMTNYQVKSLLTALGTQLVGYGYSKEQAQIIIQAIQKEAGKESIKIDPKTFDISLDKGSSFLSGVKKAVNDYQQSFQHIFESQGDNPLVQYFNAEDIAKTEAAVQSLAAALSGLSGQFGQGLIKSKDYLRTLTELSNQLNSSSDTTQLQKTLTALNPLLGAQTQQIADSGNKKGLTAVLTAYMSGLTLSPEIFNILANGGPLAEKQVNLINKAIGQKATQNDKVTNARNQIKQATQDLKDYDKIEKSINDKYDKRVKALQQIKDLNDKIKQQEQDRLALAEALSRGDLSAAAEAMLNIRTNQANASLDSQQSALETARQTALAPIQAQQQTAQTTIDNASQTIDNATIAADNIVVNVAKIDKVATDIVLGQDTSGAGSNRPVSDIENTLDRRALTVSGHPNALVFNFSPFYASYTASGGKLKPKDFKPGFTFTNVDGYSYKILKLQNPSVSGGTFTADRIDNFAIGGHVTGPGSGTSDSIPAMLSNGEYVVRANAVKAIGIDTLDKLNQADKLGFASGGMINHFKGGGKTNPYTPNEGGLPTNEKLPADTSNFNDIHGWMVARPGAGINKYGDEIYGYTRNEKTGKYTFNSAMDAYRYYSILIKNRRKLVPYIEEKYQEHLNGGWMFSSDANNFRISNLVANKTYGPFNGLTQNEAITFAKAISAVYGKNNLSKIWKQFGLSSRLLGKPIKLTPEQQRLYSAFAGEVTPSLPDDAPRFSYFANGGLVGYEDGGYTDRNNPEYWDARRRYIMHPGEYLWLLAERFLPYQPAGTTLNDFAQQIIASNTHPNSGNPSLLSIGEHVFIPGISYPPKSGKPLRPSRSRRPLVVPGGSEIKLLESHVGQGGGGIGGGLFGFGPRLYANGGMVMPRFSFGGYAMGTDTVPAMLTPGEFVIKKSAVDRIGSATLNKINGYADGGIVGGSSTSVGDSVYNININVRSDSNPDQIAQVVVNQLKRIDSQRIRGISV